MTDHPHIVLMATSRFGVPLVDQLAPLDPIIYSQPPRPQGRGWNIRPSPVHQAAKTYDLVVHTPGGLSEKPPILDVFPDGRPDLIITASYGHILTSDWLEWPRWGCVNVHASLLPRWRGAAPIQRAIMAGDLKTGITLMVMELGLDTGPIIAQKKITIAATTAGIIENHLAKLGATMVLDFISLGKQGVSDAITSAQPQPQSGITYAAKIGRDDQGIDWQQSASTLQGHIHGLSPKPGAFCFTQDGKRLKILQVVAEKTPVHHGTAPGQLLGSGMRIACGQGVLRIIYLQREGGKPIGADDFRRGMPSIECLVSGHNPKNLQ